MKGGRMNKLPKNKLIQGDCLEVMEKLPANSVDLVLTDPPFGISKEVTITRGKNEMKFKGGDISLDFGDWDKFDDLDDFMMFTFAWADECVRVLKEDSVFISYFDRDKINFLSHYLQEKGFRLRNYVADCKKNPVPQARKVNWMSSWEEIGIWSRGKHHYNFEEGQHKEYFLRPIVGGNERLDHPAQKPLSTAMDLIKWWSFESDTVLDPFAGTGTTLVAAQKLGRKWIGIDQNPDFVEMAKERISGECSQKIKKFA